MKSLEVRSAGFHGQQAGNVLSPCLSVLGPAIGGRLFRASQAAKEGSACSLLCANCSKSLLQRRNGEGLDHSPCWLGLDHHDLAEDLPLSSFRRRLQARLDHAQAREHKLARFLDLLRANPM